MAPLIALIVVTCAARAVGSMGLSYVDSWPEATAIGLVSMFLITGTAHFVEPRRSGLVAIVPPLLPRPGAWVTATGVIELLGSGMLLVPPSAGSMRTVAAWILALLLVAMFPANVYASKRRRHEHAPRTPLLLRTAMQCVFVVAALFVAIAS